MQCPLNTLIYIKTNFFFHLVRNISEAVTQRCFVKKVLLEILQNSKESTCVRVCFSIKLQAYNFIKRDSDIGVFLIQDLKNFLSLEDDKEHI